MDIITKIITNVLTALYQPFWFSVILSVLFMFLLLYAKEHGWKKSFQAWINEFKASSYFRRMFMLVFYTTMILFRTLLNRNMWTSPLSDVMGGWQIWEESNGETVLTTDPIENVMLFIPFIMLLLWAIRSCENAKILQDVKLSKTIWLSLKITFLFSITIEFLQLFLQLGTWQLSDIFYNTLGGITGGFLYWICYRFKHRVKQ